jgi:hypothetical protein
MDDWELVQSWKYYKGWKVGVICNGSMLYWIARTKEEAFWMAAQALPI